MGGLQSSSLPAKRRLILTYLANLLQAGTNATPYSMVTAAGPPYTPADMRDDEILVTDWLADDLHVQPGDWVELTSFVPESGARLVGVNEPFPRAWYCASRGHLCRPHADAGFPGHRERREHARLGRGFRG